MSLIRTVSGVRGVVDTDLTEEVVYRHALAFAELLPPGTILLARDSRSHGLRFMAVAAQAMRASRRQVLVADLVPTPTAQFLVTHHRLAGALVITASHNPTEYNGLKFMGSDGVFLGSEHCDVLFGRADQAEAPAAFKTGKVLGHGLPDAAGPHILNVLDLSCIDVEAILRHHCRVVVDTVNGAASFALPALLESLGCEVVRIHTTPDGTFPRGSEPVPANLADLGNAVRDHGADLGLATDPDADRLALVDETGTPIGEEYTQVIAMDGYFRRTGSGKPVVTNLSSSRLVDIMAESHGAEVLRAAVGEVNVVNKMRSVGAEIGGEGNGGVILAECHLGRDSLVGSALVLDRLAQEREPLSAVVAQWPRLTMIKEKVSIKGSRTTDMVAQLTATFKGADRVDTTDGIKINQGAGWVHVRQSNTEPVVRIIAEAPTEAEVRKLIDSARTAILDGAAA